ncbi:MAG TPA: hypothetical protein VE684_16345 [Crenalkalicoccus sp.]|nr:hypothetical protein [Crenalkalicoccus sp.]
MVRRRELSLFLVSAVATTHFPAALAPAAAPAEAAVHSPPAHVEPVAGSDLRRITLTDRAAARIDVRAEEVRADASGQVVVPYSAILYDLSGATWVYISPAPRAFVRHPVAVARIDGGTAYLKEGPPVGTSVVTVGVPQLYGAEKGVGH